MIEKVLALNGVELARNECHVYDNALEVRMSEATLDPKDPNLNPEATETAKEEKGGSFIDDALNIVTKIPDFLSMLVKRPEFPYGAALFVAFFFAFWPLFSQLPTIWFDERQGGYYSHGILIPLISGYVIWRWWPRLKEKPAKAGWFALIPILFSGWLLMAGIRGQQVQFQSASLVFMIFSAIWFVAGIRWAFALLVPTLYLFFGLPIWTAFIDNYTNDLQILSTDVAQGILSLPIWGHDMVRSGNDTVILFGDFHLDVGVPCSGLKLLLSVTAFTCLFWIIGGLKWWGNLALGLIVFPLCLFINGLRIALIGVVGANFGEAAGHQFHDYSGYLTLIICFVILFKIARILGWQD